ncbi:hypothetical protein QJS10_CPA05g02403 [Acorus calamus]|uniref:Methionyl-tRNA synthetase n=1 Tax=Acorus calamus TaxID=4465 RepID=A0AAV9ETH2_ACOCL|nr:hypothetical protein QJS10_CPA05g02403 [Acorus calamus]
MCLVFLCDEEERVVDREKAPGNCPYCGGMVESMEVETQWRLCFLPLFFKHRRRFFCTFCSRQLVLYP